MIKYIIPLVFLLGCTKEETPDYHTECAYILTRIVNIQNIRDVSRKDFHLTVNDKRAGKVSDGVWTHERDRWLSQENRLATTVNDLYVEAHTKGCFDTKEGEDE